MVLQISGDTFYVGLLRRVDDNLALTECYDRLQCFLIVRNHFRTLVLAFFQCSFQIGGFLFLVAEFVCRISHAFILGVYVLT